MCTKGDGACTKEDGSHVSGEEGGFARKTPTMSNQECAKCN